MSGRFCSQTTDASWPAGTTRFPPALPLGAPRRPELDWARLALQAVTFLVWSLRSWSIPLPHHDDWVVRILAGRLPAAFDLCALGLLLLLSGEAIRRELEAFGPRVYLLRRVLRLFVPFVAGVLLLGPPQTYLELVLDGSARLSLSGLLQRWTSGTVALHGYQLAYLGLLFVLSLCFAPIYLIVRRRIGALSAGLRVATMAATVALPAAALALPPGAAIPTAAAAAVLCGWLALDAGPTERLWRRLSPWLSAAAVAALAASFRAPSSAAEALRRAGAWLLAVSALGLLRRPLSRLPQPSLAVRELGLALTVLGRPVTAWLAYLLRGISQPVLRGMLVTGLAAAAVVGLGLLARTTTLSRFFVGLRPDVRG